MKAAVVITMLLILVGGVFAAWCGYMFYFGDGAAGTRPSYPPSDYDPDLTKVAKSALPIISAIRKYQVQHGDYPDNAAKLAPLLPKAVFDDASQMIDGWSYFHSPKSAGFSLEFSLGWDPGLEYQWKGTSGSWVFDPGDGSPQKQLKLNP